MSITRAAKQPRAAYLDFPLGHTAGKAHDPDLQRQILIDAFDVLSESTESGEIVSLAYHWADDDAWKDRVMRPDPGRQSDHDDNRVERFDTPQYQTTDDEAAGTRNERADGCPTCVWIEA
jgi:hypothetical protein